MRHARSIGGRIAALFFVVFATAATAAGPWDAEKIASAASETARLLDGDGKVVDTLSVSQVKALLDVEQRVTAIAGITAKLFILDGDSPNAFATDAPGYNIVAVNTAMMKIVGDDADLFAVVLGHELAHLAKGHVRAKMERNRALELYRAILLEQQVKMTVAASNAEARSSLIMAELVALKFDREQEWEADATGLMWMFKAGFDPNAALRFWQKMPQSEGGVLSDHPGTVERFIQLQAQIAMVLPPKREVPRSTRNVIVKKVVASKSGDIKEEEAPPATNDDLIVRVFNTYGKRRYAESFALAKQLADAGDARGQAMLAMYYRDGMGVEPDLAKAEYYYGLAGAQGSAVANNALGNMIMDGKASTRDPAVAAGYFQKAVDANYTAALAGLGIMKIQGRGVPKDDAGGFALIRRASDAHEPIAQFFVGLAYLRGDRIAKNPDEAARLLSAAWESGINLAGPYLGLMYAEGTGIQKDPAKAKAILEESLRNGDPSGAYFLALMYKVGNGVPADKVTAFAYSDVAAKMGMRGADKLRDSLSPLLSSDETVQAANLERNLFPRPPAEYGKRPRLY